MKLHPLARLLAFSLALASASAHADTITIVADEWCPYNCVPGSAKPGYMIEIAQQVFGAAGHTVKYSNLPWSRAIAETRQGKYSAIVGATTGDAEDFKFPANSLGKSSNVFWVNKGDAWKYLGIASLDKVSLGSIQDYSYGDELDAYIAKHAKDSKRVQVATGDGALDTNLKKLAAKRIGAVVEEKNVAQMAIADAGMTGKFTVAGNLGEDPIYIAFSPKLANGAAYAKLLSDGVAKLRASGELAKILQKYGLSDWK